MNLNMSFLDLIKVWQQALRDITHNNKAANVCPTTSLMKQ